MRYHTIGTVLAAIAVSSYGRQAGAAVVQFGTPSLLTVPDGGTLTWTMSVPDVAGGSGWTGTAAFHAINTKGTGAVNGRIVPSQTAHAINTKGTGAVNGFVLSPPGGTTGSVMFSDLTVSADNTGYDARAAATYETPGGTSYTGIFLDVDLQPLNGSTFAGTPKISLSDDLTTLNLDYTVVQPSGATADTETAVLTVSASTVPEPSIALTALTACVALNGRVRSRTDKGRIADR